MAGIHGPNLFGSKIRKYFRIHKRAAAHSQHRGTFKPFSQDLCQNL